MEKSGNFLTNLTRKRSFRKSYSRVLRRRKNMRIPVRVLVLIGKDGGEEASVSFNTYIVNFSRGGFCIRWDFCETCLGYGMIEIHRKCPFYKYDSGKWDSKDLDFYILDSYENELHFTGKAVYTYKHNGQEQIGLCFTEVSDDILDILNETGVSGAKLV